MVFITKARKERGITIYSLAKKVGLPASTIQGAEKSGNPTYRVLKLIAEGLDMDTSELVKYDD